MLTLFEIGRFYEKEFDFKMDNIYNCFPGGKSKALTMSYDDGSLSDRRLVEIFNRFKIKGTFHLNSGKFDIEGVLNSGEINSLFKGHEVSSHTLTHPYLQSIPKARIVKEILEDRNNLEKLVGYPVRGMSYPYGTYNDTVIEVLQTLGIEYSRTVVSTGGFAIPEDFLTWDPTCHHNENLMEKAREFLSWDRKGTMALMYVWGHSGEFDKENNWELIEEFAKLVGNNTSIWYATNIEIVDYLKAINNLKFSSTYSMAYNPSALSVWVEVNKIGVMIKPGETKDLTA